MVKRVVLQSGTWAGGTAAGRFIIAAPAGGNFTAGAFTAGVAATCSGAEAQITIAKDGRYEFEIENFYGQIDNKRIYGASGADRGFEFDGTVYVPINTGMSPDKPTHVFTHKKHLFFSFASSTQHSGIGVPYQWTPISGAAELTHGDTVTGFMSLPGSETGGGAAAIFTRNRMNILYGSSSADWNLVSYGKEQGAYVQSAQRVGGMAAIMDDRGVTNVATSANYGNFTTTSLSLRFYTWLNARRTLFNTSCVSRTKDQYRMFFGDKYALYFTFYGNKLRGAMPMLFSHVVKCVWSGEKNDGSEAIFFGSDNGYVYQMEKGTSHDGGNIHAYFKLVFNSARSVRQMKRYKSAMFEVSGEGYAEFDFSYELGYGSSEIVQPSSSAAVVDLSVPLWDNFIWDNFTWDGRSLLPSVLDMEGSAENVSLIINSNSDYFAATRFSGAVIHYTPRRGLR